MVDGNELRAALDRHEGPLLAYARRMVGDAGLAEDVVQETFLELCRADGAALGARIPEWLFTVCRNRALDHLRKEKAMKARERTVAREPVGAQHAAPPDDAIERGEEASKAMRCLEALPAKQQEALRLKFEGGLSYLEIGRVMREPVGTIGWWIHEGLKTLRTSMRAGEVRS
jgi:RNA polymerase sigma factor (sigma-70 family)